MTKMLITSGPDKTPHSRTSGLGLHCLPMSHKKDTGLIWVHDKITLNLHLDRAD